MQCPRCRTENGEAAIRCTGCGAPIALGDEVAGEPVGLRLPLDRRSGPREGAGPGWEMAPPAEADTREVRMPPRRAQRPRPRPAAPPAPEFEVDVEVGSIEVHRQRAPAWRRAASWTVDGLLVSAVLAAMLLPVLGPLLGPGGLQQAPGIAAPALMVVALVAFAWGWLGTALAGATPGMAAAGLRVVGPDGRRPSPGRAAVRSALALLAAAPLGAGLLLALFTRGGQGAHDMAASTWVVLAARRGRQS